MAIIPEGKSALEIAALCASVVSCLAVFVAICAIAANWRIQREQTARNAYIKYLEMAFQNPRFAFPDWSTIDLKREVFFSNDPAEGKRDFEKYEWFISMMLNTADFVFTAVPRDHVLAKQMTLQFAYHWRYIEEFKLRKNYFKRWYSKHKARIEEGVRLGKLEFTRGHAGAAAPPASGCGS